MIKPVPENMAQLVAAVRSRFEVNRQLTVWDAVEQVLNQVLISQLHIILRRSQGTHSWCRRAVASDDEELMAITVEHIGLLLRLDPRIKREDDRRSRGRARPPRRSSRRSGR